MNKTAAIYAVVAAIPHGRVMTYGAVARAAGLPNHVRMVGRVLHNNPDPSSIPCHRVVFADGRVSAGFAFGGAEAQRRLLEQEGVEFRGGKVDIDKSIHL